MRKRRDEPLRVNDPEDGETSPVDWPAWLPRRLLTVEDIAQLFNVSPKTVRRMIDSGQLRRAGLGRLVRVDPQSALDLINGK